jgi:hypothetical protein
MGKLAATMPRSFTLREPLDIPADATVTVLLKFNVNNQHNIGRFRLAVTDVKKPALDTAVVARDVQALLAKLATAKDAHSLSNAETEKLFAWWSGRDQELKKLQAKLQTEQAKEPKNQDQYFDLRRRLQTDAS